MKSIFISGTDTDCGKTYATCQLLAYLQQGNKRAIGFKAIASGCIESNGELFSEDAKQLDAHSSEHDASIKTWRFFPPISPHIAAARENTLITAAMLAESAAELKEDLADYLLFEGAGGLMCPLNAEETWLDFIKLSQIPVILVVGMRLGCLNHALLSDFVLSNLALPYMGWIANFVDPEMLEQEANLQTLKSRLQAPCLGRIPFGGSFQSNGLL